MGGKRPRAKVEPHPAKIAKSITPPDYRKDNPSWRVGAMLLVSPFGWKEMTSAEVWRVHERLKEFERLTWGEILYPPTGRRVHHRMPVNEICQEALQQLAEKKLNDADDLISLRITGSERIWGVLQASTLLLLWWDPHHLVYPMNIADN